MKKTSSITVSNGQFILDGKPFFLYSGEIHYFRMPQNLWKKHLQKAKDAGLNTVSFYVPWSWHEYEEGKFDFTGKTHPQRNLVKFLNLAKSMGLYAAARVGPVSNAELTGEGIPDWLLKNYKDIFIQRSGVNNLPHAILLSYLHPTFQSFVGKWYQELLPIISANQIQKDGPVIFVQLCNEIGMIHWLHKASNPAPFVTKLYQDFLREKYPSVDALNRAYGASFESFDHIEQPEGNPEPKTLAIFFDWALFYRRYYALYYETLYKRAKEHGIEVPLSANIPQFYDYDVRGRGVYSPMTTSLFREFSAKAPGTVFGGAYQMRRLDFENFHDISVTTEAVRAISDSGEGSVKAPIICAELQTGILRDRPRLYPSDIDLNLKTSTAHGLNGVNCYMFSSGKNLPEMGCFGTYHDWQAPVGLHGDERPHFQPIKDFGRFIRKWGTSLAETEKVFDTSLGFYLPYFSTEYFSGPWAGSVEWMRHAYFFDGIARLLQIAGYNFSFTDLQRATSESLAEQKSLCVFSLEWMDEKTQNLLADYVRRGGKLFIGPRLPTLDLSGKSCKNLIESLALEPETVSKAERAYWNKLEFIPDFPIQTFKGHAEPLVQTKSHGPCVSFGHSGQGKWVAYGLGLLHNFDYQAEMVRSWMEKLGVRPRIKLDPWDLHGVLRWKDEKGFLFLFNYHDAAKSGTVTVTLDGKGAPVFKKQIHLERRSAGIIPLTLKGKKIVEVR